MYVPAHTRRLLLLPGLTALTFHRSLTVCLLLVYPTTRTHSPRPPPLNPWPGHTRSLTVCSWCTRPWTTEYPAKAGDGKHCAGLDGLLRSVETAASSRTSANTTVTPDVLHEVRAAAGVTTTEEATAAGREDPAAAAALTKVRPGGCCSPRHRTHFHPRFSSLMAPYDVAIKGPGGQCSPCHPTCHNRLALNPGVRVRRCCVHLQGSDRGGVAPDAAESGWDWRIMLVTSYVAI